MAEITPKRFLARRTQQTRKTTLLRKSANETPWKLNLVARRWQVEALETWKKAFRGVVKVVTGAGKTIFGEMCMLAFKERFPCGRFLIVVPTVALLDQRYVSLTEDLCIPEQDIACFSGEDKPAEPRLINLLLVNTGRMLASRLSEGAETCLIVDECHRTGSVINARALHGKHAAALGLSATPEREYDEGFQQLISPVLGDVIYEYDYSRASQDGVISQFRLVNVRVDMLPDEKCAFDRLSRQAAKESLARIAQLPIEITPADMPAAQQAATLNAKFGPPYADCFAAALAVSRFAT